MNIKKIKNKVMEKSKTISVWLQTEDGKTALQRRSEKEKSFPFVCQATWSGGVDAGESVWECHHYVGKINFVFVDKNTEIYSTESGKNPKENIVLFDDQYQVLREIINGKWK